MSGQFMPMFWGQYLGDTSDLSQGEHGAYLLLIAHQWRTHAPIPADRVYRVTKATTKKERDNTNSVLERHFFFDGSTYENLRVKRELEADAERSEKRRQQTKAATAARHGGRSVTETVTDPLTESYKYQYKELTLDPSKSEHHGARAGSFAPQDVSDCWGHFREKLKTTPNPPKDEWIPGFLSTYQAPESKHVGTAQPLTEIWKAVVDEGFALGKFHPNWFMKVFRARVEEWQPGAQAPKATQSKPYRSVNAKHEGKKEGVIDDFC
mgnify:CR=1 FL=1